MSELLHEFEAVKQRLDDLTEILGHVAPWRDDLLCRIWRTRLIFELVDTDVDIDELIDEVRDFERVCRCLLWLGQAERVAG
jgi:hypothetical protein